MAVDTVQLYLQRNLGHSMHYRLGRYDECRHYYNNMLQESVLPKSETAADRIQSLPCARPVHLE